jgi:hypothetical protein
MRPLPYEDNEQYLKIPLDLTVRGKYRQILKFIELVEKDMPNTSEITSLEFTPGSQRIVPAKEEETDNAGSLTEPLKNAAQKAVTSSVPSENVPQGASAQLTLSSEADPDVDVYLTW